MYDAGCLSKLEFLIEHRKPLIRKEAIWAISNVLAESSQILGQILETGLLAKLLSIIILDVTLVILNIYLFF